MRTVLQQRARDRVRARLGSYLPKHARQSSNRQATLNQGATTMTYAKAIVALFGVAVTTLLGLLPDHTTPLWTTLTVLSAVLTAAGVYLVPNTPPTPPGA